MTHKITIDQEIENIKNELNNIEDTSPYYLGPDLKEVQGYVFVHHALVESGIDSLILLKAELSIKLDDTASMAFVRQIYPMVEKLSFYAKLELLEDEYLSGEVADNLLKSLGALNKIRNEWAHTKGDDLRAKYSYQTAKGKEKIRDTFRAIKLAHDSLNEYFRNAK